MSGRLAQDGGHTGLGARELAAFRDGPLLVKSGLDILMPLHVWVGPTGFILRVGPTLQKLRPREVLVGRRLLEVFEVRRPLAVRVMADLLARDGAKVQIIFRAAPGDALRGVVVALAKGQGALLNLSLGISVVEAVRIYGLTGNDFAPSDPTVEMLYLIEAQAAILGESRKLNKRLESARIAAEEQAFTDTLTGLRNRRAMDHVLARLAEPGELECFGLMQIDLDYFKAVNDTHGHGAGDLVLRHVARILLEETRSDDVVVRAGGDEFVLICRNCDDPEVLSAVARRIIERLEDPIALARGACRISASIGTTLSTNYARPDAARMLHDADKALYVSKEAGRARHTIFTGAPTLAGTGSDGADLPDAASEGARAC